MEMIKNIDTS